MTRIAPIALASALVSTVMYVERPKPRVAPVVAPHQEYSYLPLAGRPLADGARDGVNCLAFLDHLVQHPNWTLGIVETEWTVLEGTHVTSTFTIAADGRVSFDRLVDRSALPSRTFYLTNRELGMIRMSNRLPCSELAHPVDHARTFTVNYSYAQSSDEDGARIPAASQMGRMFDEVLRTAAARYVPARIVRARALQLDVNVPRSPKVAYRIRVAHGILSVTRGTRVLGRYELPPDQLVDLADWNPPHEWEGGWVSDYGWARGSLLAGERHEQIVFDAGWLTSIPTVGVPLGELIDADFAELTRT